MVRHDCCVTTHTYWCQSTLPVSVIFHLTSSLYLIHVLENPLLRQYFLQGVSSRVGRRRSFKIQKTIKQTYSAFLKWHFSLDSQGRRPHTSPYRGAMLNKYEPKVRTRLSLPLCSSFWSCFPPCGNILSIGTIQSSLWSRSLHCEDVLLFWEKILLVTTVFSLFWLDVQERWMHYKIYFHSLRTPCWS